MNCIKFFILFTILTLVIVRTTDAQLKEAAQLATLTPTALVLSSSDIINAHKMHFTASAMLYLSSYLITESVWKSVVISMLIGAAKELIYDGLLGKGEPWIQDMKWNTFGVAQGAVFTLSLKL
jgi:ABC-type sugar transport system permease subunit